MVIAPLLVVKVNWPSTEAGSINSNSSGSLSVRLIARAVESWGKVAKQFPLAQGWTPAQGACCGQAKLPQMTPC